MALTRQAAAQSPIRALGTAMPTKALWETADFSPACTAILVLVFAKDVVFMVCLRLFHF
jgi:hypothetical protein